MEREKAWATAIPGRKHAMRRPLCNLLCLINDARTEAIEVLTGRRPTLLIFVAEHVTLVHVVSTVRRRKLGSE